MREEVLAAFFAGTASAAELATDLAGAEERVSDVESLVKIKDMRSELVVTREMAVRLCDAVLRNELPPTALATIGFALLASDHFVWDWDDVLGEIIWDWSCPEVNYALNLENVKRFRAWLTGEEAYPARSSAERSAGSRLISIRRKKIRVTKPPVPSKTPAQAKLIDLRFAPRISAADRGRPLQVEKRASDPHHL